MCSSDLHSPQPSGRRLPATRRLAVCRVETALAGDPVMAVLNASDGAADGARKIAAAVARRQTGENAREIPIVSRFTSAQLDLALGRSNVVHAALLAGPASNGFLERYRSLERFRIDPDGRGTG